MSTFLTLVNEVLMRTGQQSVSTVVNAESPVKQVKVFMNDIYMELTQSVKPHFLEAKATFSTTAGTATYTLSADADVNSILKQSVVDMTHQRRLQKMKADSVTPEQAQRQDHPSHFWIEGTQLRLFPIPSGAFSIEYRYRRVPSKLVNDADQPVLPVAWERLLVRGTQALLEKYLGEVQNSQLSWGLYQEGLSLMRATMQEKQGYTMQPFYHYE